MACEQTTSFEIAFVYPHTSDLSVEASPLEDVSKVYFSMRQDDTIVQEGDFISMDKVELSDLPKPTEPWRFYFSQGSEVASKVVGSSRLWRPRPKAPAFDTVLLTKETMLAAYAANEVDLNSATFLEGDRWSLILDNGANPEIHLALRWLNNTLTILASTQKVAGEDYTLKLYLERHENIGVEEIVFVENATPPEQSLVVRAESTTQDGVLTFFMQLDLSTETTTNLSITSEEIDLSTLGKRHGQALRIGLGLEAGINWRLEWPQSFSADLPPATELGSLLFFPPFLDAIHKANEDLVLMNVADDTQYPALPVACQNGFDAQATLRVRSDENLLALGLNVSDSVIVVANNGDLSESDAASFYVVTANNPDVAANILRIDVLAPYADHACEIELLPIYVDTDWDSNTSDTLLTTQAQVYRCPQEDGYLINIGLPLSALENPVHRTLLAFDVVLHSMAIDSQKAKLCSMQGEKDGKEVLSTQGLGEIRIFQIDNH